VGDRRSYVAPTGDSIIIISSLHGFLAFAGNQPFQCYLLTCTNSCTLLPLLSFLYAQQRCACCLINEYDDDDSDDDDADGDDDDDVSNFSVFLIPLRDDELLAN